MNVCVREVTTVEGVLAAAGLFDGSPTAGGAAAFLDAPGHHLLVAEVSGVPAGFVTGIEMRHPDKGLELFVDELGVEEAHQRRGVASALLDALGDVAVRLGATGCWTATEPDNTAALATYARLGGDREDVALFSWTPPTRSGDSDRPTA